MNVVRSDFVRLPLDAIALDPELQPRAELDRATYEDYGHALVDGAAFPPVLVVVDGDARWLADGYHRWHAHKALGLVDIAAELRPGTRLDALRLSLAANAEHGKRREPGDYRRAYDLAVKHGLVAATDAEGVAALLRCTGRWAEVLTKDARDAEWDAKLEAARNAPPGETVRATAERLGVSPATVTRAQRVSEANPSPEKHGPDPEQVDPADQEGQDPRALRAPRDSERAAREADARRAEAAAAIRLAERAAELDSEPARLWHGVLEALRAVNALPHPDALYCQRYERVDHAIGPELVKAGDWIAAMQRRFFA